MPTTAGQWASLMLCRILELDSVDGDSVVEVTGAPRCGMGDLVAMEPF